MEMVSYEAFFDLEVAVPHITEVYVFMSTCVCVLCACACPSCLYIIEVCVFSVYACPNLPSSHCGLWITYITQF